MEANYLAVTVVVNLSSNIVEHNYLLKQFKAYTKISGSSTVTKIGATLHLLIRTHYQRSRYAFSSIGYLPQ